MKTFKIPYQDTQKFSKLVIDYLNEDEKLQSFVNHFPSLDNFEKQIIEKVKKLESKSHSLEKYLTERLENLENRAEFIDEDLDCIHRALDAV